MKASDKASGLGADTSNPKLEENEGLINMIDAPEATTHSTFIQLVLEKLRSVETYIDEHTQSPLIPGFDSPYPRLISSESEEEEE